MPSSFRSRSRSQAPRPWGFRPSLETLEERLPPGDILFSLGLGAAPTAELALTQEQPAAVERVLSNREGDSNYTQSADVSGWTPSPVSSEQGRNGSTSRLPSSEWTDSGTSRSLFAAEGDFLASWETALANRSARSVHPSMQSGGLSRSPGMIAESSSIPSRAPSHGFERGPATPTAANTSHPDDAAFLAGLWLAVQPALSRSAASTALLFNHATGQLTIRADAPQSTVGETITPSGFIQVTLNGQRHASDPSSVSFDPSLSGINRSTLTGVRLESRDEHAMLTLGAQTLTGGFTAVAPAITVAGVVRAATVTLASTGTINVAADGALRADSGGRIDVAGQVVMNSGQLQADGASGGQVVVSAANVLNTGRISADGLSGAGGTVWVGFTAAYVDTAAAVASARGVLGRGGHLILDGGDTGRLFSSGVQEAAGTDQGGTVALLGRDVILDGNTADASGRLGGGTVSVGAQADATQTVLVTPATTLRADALGRGNGGAVALWADQDTEFAGTVSARGGLTGGAGGTIEVSGEGNLNYAGTADAGAGGTLVLDPKNLVIDAGPAGLLPQFNLIDPHPTAGGGFGTQVVVLNSGNILVTNPNDSFGGSNAGAVYLFNGQTGALISSLVGAAANDKVGANPILTLASGNFLVSTPTWNGNSGAVTWGSATTGVSGAVAVANSLVGSNSGDRVGDAMNVILLKNGNYLVLTPTWNSAHGAVTWGNGTTGVRGAISATNSLIGANSGDGLGNPTALTILGNGNYVISSLLWNNGRGSVTWGSGTAGVTGTVSATNSLTGSDPGDLIGASITVLGNGNYVINSPSWSGSKGAATWASGTAPIQGIVSAANSLVGSSPGDDVGLFNVALSNGNYVVGSPVWGGGKGAATWASGTTGITGSISATNSLTGGSANDQVGFGGIIALTNGNYLIGSPNWNGSQGAMTWASGTTGITGSVSASNSLVGSNMGDQVGNFAHSVLLTNGNYVIGTPTWNGGQGAATWASGTAPIQGIVSAANSLVGANSGDQVGLLAIPLTNGNYLVGSPNWNGNRGAMTWASGTTGITGSVSASNSLVGSNMGDQVGLLAFPLNNGNYVIGSPAWSNGQGAATWASGTTGITGSISATNSLVGSNMGDQVGIVVLPLTNSNYLVGSPTWNGNQGAATWGSGTTGVAGTVSATNSLVGSTAGDQVGSEAIPLRNGSYVIQVSTWNNNRGAVLWGNGTAAISGPISASNSLVGTSAGDQIGTFVLPLPNDSYVVGSPNWNGGQGAATWSSDTAGVVGPVAAANSLVGATAGDHVGSLGTVLRNGNFVIQTPAWNGNRGAATWGSAAAGVRGVVSAANSLVGTSAGDQIGATVMPLANGNYLAGSASWNNGRGALAWVNGTTGQTLDGSSTITPPNSLTGQAANAGLTTINEDAMHQAFVASFVTDGTGRVAIGSLDPNQFTFARGQGQTVTIAPSFLTRTLNAGTALVLQASNDITINSPIIVSAGGQGGALTLQAGRSILLNAGITTDGGALNLIANDQLASGVVDAQRDPGPAVITMAAGTSLNTGAANLTVDLRDGAGKTNTTSGAITLQTLTAATVAVTNHGPTAGSGITLGAVTSTGPQSYSNPNGVTTLTAALTTGDNPVTFTDAVAVNAGVSVSAGAAALTFVGSGTQTLQMGSGASLGNVLYSGGGTLRLTQGPLNVTGTLDIAAGTFDANGQTVTVAGLTTIDNGATYLGGTAAQTFNGGLSMPAGGSLDGANLVLNGALTAGEDSQSNPATITGNLSLSAAGSTVTVTPGQGEVQLEIDAVISGNGGLTEMGGGALRLTAANTYTGPTVVQEGLLLVDGSQASDVSLNGGRLGGAGTLNNINVSGGTLNPGDLDTPGVLSAMGAAAFATGTTFNVRLNGTDLGTGYDQLNVAGPVDLDSDAGAGSLLTVSVGYAASVGDTFTIITTTGGVNNTFQGLAEGAIIDVNGVGFQITYQANGGNDVMLTCVYTN